jgi:hypothetical protein
MNSKQSQDSSKNTLESLNEFFSSLGYQIGDNVCFQYLAPNGDNSKIFAKNQLTMTYPLKSVPIHKEPFRIFYIVNGQGFLGSDIKKCYAIFCEYDNLPLSEQREFWKKYDLPKPSIQVFTGGKSIHHYWVFDTPVTDITAWNDLMNDLIILCGSDKSVKNANRLLRPPTFNYCDKNGKFNSEITTVINNTGKKYSYVELRNAIPSSKSDSIPVLTDSKDIPLTPEQELKLIDDIIPLIPYARSSGSYDDYRKFLGAIKNIKGEQFAIDLGSRIIDNNGDWNQIINSTTGKFPIGTIINFAKQYANFDYDQWLKENRPYKKDKNSVKNSDDTRRNLDKTYEKSSNEVNELDTAKIISQLVDKLAKPEISESERALEIAKYSSIYRFPPSILQKAIAERLKDDDRKQQLEVLSPNLNDLINTPKKKLNLKLIFGDFATHLEDFAQQVPTNPDAIVTCLLPAIASVVGTRCKIMINPATNYYQPFILRTMIVADSGQKKSPTAKVALNPLTEKNKELAMSYKKAYQDYEKSLNDWKTAKKDEKGEMPLEPTQKRLIIQDSTIDGMIKAHSENPDGLLCFVDELNGYFKRMNKFARNGVGDDLERDLELYNGNELIKTRASKDNCLFLPQTAISITGTIQTAMVEELFNKNSDFQGVTSRWLIWAGEMPKGYLQPRGCNEHQFFSELKNFFTGLSYYDFPKYLTISNDAYKAFMKWQHDTIDKIDSLDLPQVKMKYAKIEGEVARLAGVMFFWNYYMNPDVPSGGNEIKLMTMSQALDLATYYLEHFAYICTKAQGDLLDSRLMKILELVNKKGIVTASQVKRSLWELRTVNTDEVEKMLLDLVAIGKIELVSTHKGVKVQAKKRE